MHWKLICISKLWLNSVCSWRARHFLERFDPPARYLPSLHWREPQAGDWLSGWIRNCYTPLNNHRSLSLHVSLLWWFNWNIKILLFLLSWIFPPPLICSCFGVFRITAILVHAHCFLESHLCYGSNWWRIFALVLLLKDRLILQLLLSCKIEAGLKYLGGLLFLL